MVPSANGQMKKDNRGRFVKGNPGGPGNPQVAMVSKLRFALLGAISVDDVVAIAKTMVKSARAGDVIAGREILDRVLGKPTQSIDLTGAPPVNIQIVVPVLPPED